LLNGSILQKDMASLLLIKEGKMRLSTSLSSVNQDMTPFVQDKKLALMSSTIMAESLQPIYFCGLSLNCQTLSRKVLLDNVNSGLGNVETSIKTKGYLIAMDSRVKPENDNCCVFAGFIPPYSVILELEPVDPYRVDPHLIILLIPNWR